MCAMQNFHSDFEAHNIEVDIVDKDSEEQFSYFQPLSDKHLQIESQSEAQSQERKPTPVKKSTMTRNDQGAHKDEDVDVVSLFCNFKRTKKAKEDDHLSISSSKKEENNKFQNSRVKDKQLSITSKENSKKDNQSIVWIRDDDFNDEINWSDDDKFRPKNPHEPYFSKADLTSIKRQRSTFQVHSKKVQKQKRPNKMANRLNVPNRFKEDSYYKINSVSSQELKAKRSQRSKENSLRLLSHVIEQREDDDRKWFDQVKFEEMTPQQIERVREEKTRERRQYEEYKKRFYRKKKFSESRKIFTKSQLENLRHEFQLFHNRDGQDDAENFRSRRRVSIIGLPKNTLTRLALAYQASTTTICGLYKEWRYDPTLSKTLSRFDRVFTLEFDEKPSRQIVTRQRTQQRIETLSRLLEENPFLQCNQMIEGLEQSQSYQQKIERCTIARLLRLADFNQKKLRSIRKDCNSAQSVAERKCFARYFRNYLARDYEIFFYDEMLVNQYYDKEIGWAKGEQEIVFRPQLMIDQSIVLLGLLSMTGELLWDARYGDYAKPELQQVLKSFIGTASKKSNAVSRVVVINPLNYRDFDAIRLVFQRYNWQVLKLPVNGLQLNPLFTLYLQFRYSLRRKRIKTFEALFNEVVNYFKSNQSAHFGLSYITKLQLYLRRAEEGDIF